MSPITRAPIVRSGVRYGGLPSQAGKAPGITKVVHHENFASGGYVVGQSVATHQPGVACPAHNHRGADELFYVLDGYGTITVNGEKHYVQPDDSVYVPAGAMHQVAAAPVDDGEVHIGDKPMVVLCVLVVAPGHEQDSTPWASTDS